jgi:ABC-type uncharacterized transport system auxiliary subunit
MSDSRDVYIKKIKAKLDEWNADIDRLEAKARQADADAKMRYKGRIESLKEGRRKAVDRFERMRQASGDAWKDMRAGLDHAVDSLGEALRSAKSRFQ